MRQHPGFSEEDVLVAVTPLSFDISGLELFLPLTVGGRIVVADSENGFGCKTPRGFDRGIGSYSDAGHSGDLANVARFRLAWQPAAENSLWRGKPFTKFSGQAAREECRGLEPLRPNRDDNLVHTLQSRIWT
jgi:hypothetical protein